MESATHIPVLVYIGAGTQLIYAVIQTCIALQVQRHIKKLPGLTRYLGLVMWLIASSAAMLALFNVNQWQGVYGFVFLLFVGLSLQNLWIIWFHLYNAQRFKRLGQLSDLVNQGLSEGEILEKVRQMRREE